MTGLSNGWRCSMNNNQPLRILLRSSVVLDQRCLLRTAWCGLYPAHLLQAVRGIFLIMKGLEMSNTEVKLTLTFGQKAVGLTFNPSNHEGVQIIKEAFAAVIDYLNASRELSQDSEVQRMYSIAITDAQTAQMWAVKAATWKS